MPETKSDAERHSESNVESRTILAFNIAENALLSARWLPVGWKATPADNGPFKGANLLVIFSDRFVVQEIDLEGHPLPAQKGNQLVVMGVLAQHDETQAQGVMISFGLSATAEGSPGPYDVFEPATCVFKKEISAKTESETAVMEEWNFMNQGGERIFLAIEYKRGAPSRAIDAETKAYSSKTPEFYRIYRADQGVDILKNGTGEINNISQIDFVTEGPLLRSIFNGSTALISVLSQPWTVRKVFVRDSGRLT